MISYIAHRGNLHGSIPERENHPDYIDEALDAGFDVEIDIWKLEGVNKWALGHDGPQYGITQRWLDDRWEVLWVHCKNSTALFALNPIDRSGLNFFWHENDDYTLTSSGYIWANTGQPVNNSTVIVDLPGERVFTGKSRPFGICTDYPIRSKMLKKNKR